MNLVTIDKVSHQYSERVLLDSVNLLINSGDRIGLIGVNGSGKTTLLRLIAGLERPSEGTITIWGGVNIHFLPQNPPLNPNQLVLDYLFDSDAPQMKALRQYEQLSAQVAQHPEDTAVQEQFAQAIQEMDRLNGWAAEANAKAVLTRLGITEFHTPLGQLSGGQQKRAALAHALIVPADLLILDEPTNHIDAETIDWLEKYLLNRAGALLMVTHDRYFLDRVVNKIVELDRRELVTYPGNYSQYLEQRTMRHEQLAAAEAKRQAHLRRELEWLRRGAQARSTKQKARKQRIAELQQIQHDSGSQRVAMALASRRLGKKVLEAANLSKRYGRHTLFTNLSFQLAPGDRIGIIGPNGSGKSTFLNILAGKTPPDSGTIHWGETVHLGYYDQHSERLKPEMKVIDFMNETAPLIRTNDGSRIEAAQMLEWFLFPRAQQQAKIGSLSGGERRRLYLLHTLAHQPNVLFLDEPTNDLDIQTLAVLEEFLDAFTGCLVVVSHDRYFLDRNVDFLMSFEDGVLGSRFPTPFASYLAAKEAQMAQETAVSQPKPAAPPKATPTQPTRKLSYHQKRQLAELENRIPALEAKISELEQAINNSGGDYQKLGQLHSQLEEIRSELEEAELQWLELMELTD